MSGARIPDLNDRLETYFATLRSSSLRERLKRNAGNWQLYAAATGSAIAMVTNATASIVGNGARDITPQPVANFLAGRQHFGTSQNTPIARAIRLAMAREGSGQAFLNNGAGVKSKMASQAKPPTILSHGVVPLYSTVNTIQPGEWVSIYGKNLAGGTAVWKGDFPVSLGGTSVEINGKAAYLSFVSPGQINVQAPDDTATGVVSVVVNTAGGRATSTVTMNRYSPAFDLIDARHVAGIIIRSNGSGAYGGGAYDVLGPTGSCLGYRTVAAQAGDEVALFGLGFGPTTPTVLAGRPFSGAAPINSAFTLYLNNILIEPTFVGLSSAGLYQVNLLVPPGIGEGDVPVQAMVGGMQTQMGVVFSLPGSSPSDSSDGCGYGGSGGGTGGTGGTGGAPPGGGSGGGTGGGSGGGTGGGSGGGTGGGAGGGTGGGSGGGGGSGSGSGGGSVRFPAKPYEPRLRFPAKADVEVVRNV